MMPEFDIQHFVIDLLNTQRTVTDDEIAVLRVHVSATGFDPQAETRVGRRVTGLSWRGMTLTGSEWLSIEIAHYLRHAVAAEEWPQQTTVPDYVASLRAAILDPSGPILLDTVPGWPRLTFFGQSGTSRGTNGGDWILVAYDVHYGYWTTGYQPELDPENHRHHMAGGASRWLYKPGI